uniref:uncharacterized protein LOC124028736 n=1 Tax=Oncorhynchus gorbuscha TaxID=8017 RepID=UPI001EAEFB20|nr:uncharacterized protein LOC124028736 [Oncorhynchus gorbuscha]
MLTELLYKKETPSFCRVKNIENLKIFCFIFFLKNKIETRVASLFAAVGLWSSGNMSSGEINHASPSGSLTDTSRMRKRTREHEAGSPDSDQPTKMFSKCEVQGLLQQEVQSAMKQSESKMESLLERVQLLECEPKYDLVIRRLEAHIKKVKRRGDAAISYVRMLRAPGVKHNQRRLGSGLVDLTETEKGLSTVDISRSDSDEEDSAEKQRKRKVVDGFWQKMMSNKKNPDRKKEKERNGKRSASAPVTRPPATSPVKTECTVKMETTVKTEESRVLYSPLRVPSVAE